MGWRDPGKLQRSANARFRRASYRLFKSFKLSIIESRDLIWGGSQRVTRKFLQKVLMILKGNISCMLPTGVAVELSAISSLLLRRVLHKYDKRDKSDQIPNSPRVPGRSMRRKTNYFDRIRFAFLSYLHRTRRGKHVWTN